MDTMAAIRKTFFEECEEQLAELENGLLAIEREEGDAETINAVFRAVHSIKGGAGAFGLDDLVRFTHTFETTLDGMRSGKLEATPQVVKLMLRAADVLADLVRISRDGGEPDETRISRMAQDLTKIGGVEATPTTMSEPRLGDGIEADEFGFTPVQISFDALIGDECAEPRVFEISFTPKPELYAKANDALRLLREVARLGEVQVACDTSAVPHLDTLEPEGAYLTWKMTLRTDCDEAAVREVFEFVELDCDLEIEAIDGGMDEDTAARTVQAILQEVAAQQSLGSGKEPDIALDAARHLPVANSQTSPASGQQAGSTIRVDLDRVDRLIDLVGELVINQSMLAQRVTAAGIARRSDVAIGLDDLEQLTREIQDSVMAIRAQPVRPVFQRMSRVVREIAEMTGKSVRLVTEGESCEIDKTVIERLTDPLTHMIRNAVDHGLETPQKRLAAGKPEQGTVRMTAAHRSGRVVIDVSDDGAGIDRTRVREIAVARGIIDADVELSPAEIDDLIFAPGFSTAPIISDISGRGVGMDVVRRSIQSLGGRITIVSRPGLGTTFTLSLPLTLAVLDGMVVTVAGQTLVVPLSSIVETLQPKVADVHSMGERARVIAIRGKFVPLLDVGAVLGYREEDADPFSRVAVMVETETQAQSVLLVDGIIGQQQVVIKSLETNYGQAFGVAAATILGDGRVAVILDVDAIVAGARGDGARSDANRKRNAA